MTKSITVIGKNETLIIRLLLIICVLLVSGCATPDYSVTIEPVKFSGDTAGKSELVGYLRMNTGEVTGYSPAAMIYVNPKFRPVVYDRLRKYIFLMFKEEDQEVFFESLKTELLERGMIKSIGTSYSPDKLEIVVNFILAERLTNSLSDSFRFDIMLLLKHGKITDYKIYSIASSTISFDTKKPKTKAAEKVLATVIPDIDKFISELPE